jgi:hypothetical protein
LTPCLTSCFVVLGPCILKPLFTPCLTPCLGVISLRNILTCVWTSKFDARFCRHTPCFDVMRYEVLIAHFDAIFLRRFDVIRHVLTSCCAVSDIADLTVLCQSSTEYPAGLQFDRRTFYQVIYIIIQLFFLLLCLCTNLKS